MPVSISKFRIVVQCLIPIILWGLSVTTFAVSGEEGTLSFSVIQTAQSSRTSEVMVVEGGDLFTWRKLEHVAVLVRHPKGDFLWDSGIGIEIETQTAVFSFVENLLFRLENVKSARLQLDVNGYDVKTLMAIVPSHMHWDHASGIEDFLGVPVWIQ
jgi:N-acyl homoserine lactone hydrolase